MSRQSSIEPQLGNKVLSDDDAKKLLGRIKKVRNRKFSNENENEKEKEERSTYYGKDRTQRESEERSR